MQAHPPVDNFDAFAGQIAGIVLALQAVHRFDFALNSRCNIDQDIAVTQAFGGQLVCLTVHGHEKTWAGKVRPLGLAKNRGVLAR